MVSLKQMKGLIQDVCSKMGDKYASEDAVNLVLATGIAESRYEYIRQMGDGKWEEILEKNIAAGIVHCRLKYWRVPKKMPSSVEGKANYWKKYYNSELGAGDPEHFVEVYNKYLK